LTIKLIKYKTYPLNNPLFILLYKIKLNFITWQINIIFQNLKQTLTCTNHKFIQQISIGKSYKTTHIQTTYTTWKYQKLSIRKRGYKKKWIGLFTYCGESSKINWIRIGILTNKLLGWPDLWWCELDLWQNEEGNGVAFCKKKRKKKEKWGRGRGGVVWQVLT